MSFTEKIGIVQTVKPLRKCRECSLEAWTEEDLKLFKKQKNLPYGRATWCNKCHSKNQEKYKRTKIENEIINNFPKPVICHFCGKEVKKLDELNGESLVIHSLDDNHDNWASENKTPAHRRCHTKFHSPSKNPEVAKKISIALTGITRSSETRAKMSAAKTPELKQKLSVMMSGSKNPMWKGNEASDKAKYLREWRQKKREKNE